MLAERCIRQFVDFLDKFLAVQNQFHWCWFLSIKDFGGAMSCRTELSRTTGVVFGGVIASAVSTMFLCYAYNLMNEPPEWEGPVERWIEVGLERKQLQYLDEMNVLTTDEYAAEEQTLLAIEDQIVPDLPRNTEELGKHYAEREQVMKRPDEFWLALAAWIVCSVTTMTVTILSWRRDRQLAIQAMDAISRRF